jgi:RNA polymerase sigma factor (sigma-70 family)
MLSAFNSFCQGLAAGRFPWLSDRHDLWKLLVTITARKATAEIRRQRRQKRRREVGESALGGAGQGDGNAAIEEVVGHEPTPEFAAEVAEECERLLAALGDDSLRQIAIAKLEGYTNEEIAERLDCSLRTVKRRLGRVREIWGQEEHLSPV